MIIFLEELEKSICSEKDCKHCHTNVLYIHGRCHPGKPVNVCYEKGLGQLKVTCTVCDKPIVIIAVASRCT